MQHNLYKLQLREMQRSMVRTLALVGKLAAACFSQYTPIYISTRSYARILDLTGTGDICLTDAGRDGAATAQTTGEQLAKLLELHDSLSSRALEGKHAKAKKAADGQTQVQECNLCT